MHEDVEGFTRRARAWLAKNIPPQTEDGTLLRVRTDDEELERIGRCRELQRVLYDGSLAGICVPREYGGQGLTPAHQDALNHEIVGYDYPAELQMPTFTPCMAVLLEFGTDEQKKRYIPAMLKGEALWMQFLSEPSGGSDVAAVLTTAIRDGEEWVLNGSKIWTTGAWWSDMALCLARTDWNVPKHRGLTVFVVPIHHPNIEIQRIEMLNGSKEFCQEFLTDLRVPDVDRIGEIDQGWTVGTRWMYHERTVAGGSPYVTFPDGRRPVRELAGGAKALIHLAKEAEGFQRTHTRQLIGEAHAHSLVGSALIERISRQIRAGVASGEAAAILRLYAGTTVARNSTIAFEVAGAGAIAWSNDDGDAGQVGMGYLMRQASSIGGGTTEMSRNVISERVLGMPREHDPSRSLAFRDVARNSRRPYDRGSQMDPLGELKR